LQRTDEYGGVFENRIRLLVEITKAVRDAWPAEKPLLVRVSADEWVEGGWNSHDTVKLAHILRDLGVDMLDVSSAGNTASQKITVGPGYQVPFSKAVKQNVPNLPSGTVGMISEPEQAETILKNSTHFSFDFHHVPSLTVDSQTMLTQF
jgi:2,4-dienoyl-CoA reductase-like NADH-dependent reductase (Old Yellow Enzyme family)